MEAEWNFTHKSPENEDMEATWNRRAEMIGRLSMLYYVGSHDVFEDMKRKPQNPMIRPHHFVRARERWEKLYATYPVIFDLAANTSHTKFYPPIRKQLQRLTEGSKDGWVLHSKLQRAVPNEIDHFTLKNALKTMIDGNEVLEEKVENGKRVATYYKWLG